MRTKPCDGVLRLDVTALDPRVEIHVAYDGLAGLSRRSILSDLVTEIERKGPKELPILVAALKRHGGIVTLSYLDYVSYGIGGGDATAEQVYHRTMLLWHEPARPATGKQPRVPEHLVLDRNPSLVPAGGVGIAPAVNPLERLSLE